MQLQHWSKQLPAQNWARQELEREGSDHAVVDSCEKIIVGMSHGWVFSGRAGGRTEVAMVKFRETVLLTQADIGLARRMADMLRCVVGRIKVTAR